ncbi:histone acetyltransferase HAC1-like isoform X2 [Tasmannia lanceolata]|uniref:histone acetyltransferase HAC1-like isoform X2 n=1 Tax=Tasmannia lanceolata TaxID=3420 RepID=UPI004062818D
MHVQAHMSGQISGQVPNQAGPQLPSLPQQNGNSLPSQIQNLGFRSTSNMDQELQMVRGIMRERIFQFFQRRQPSHESKHKLRDFVPRLEECLFKSATSKEEYMDLNTLEQRLLTLIRRIPSNNHRQKMPNIMSSSSSVGTMIPTPGMPQSGTVRSGDTSMSDSSMVPNTVNAGNLLPTSNGSGGIHTGSFNASDGPLPNGYQQSPANISISSGGNNMMSSMGVSRIASQMIPTPGLNNPQLMSMNSECSNGGGFSCIESTMVSQQQQHQQQQQQQPKQYIGGQNNRILQSVGSQVGIGMRSGMQQKPSSYEFSNGALNGLIGNNMQLMNGPAVSEGYLSSSSYGDSSNPIQQHFDPQSQQQLMQCDMYGMNGLDLSGSVNIYGHATTVGSTMNSQNAAPVSLQSKSKANSSLLTHQPSMQTIPQMTYIKPQMSGHSAKMNFQSPHSTRDHLLQSQPQIQKFQQQRIQQQPHQSYAQFAQHQQQQQQQNHQHQQLLLKNDNLRSNLGGQMMPGQGIKSNNEHLQAQISENFHLSELQNQYQQNSVTEYRSKGAQDSGPSLSQTSLQVSQILRPHQQTPQSQNDFSCLSAGSQPEAHLHGQRHPPLQEKTHVPDQSSLDEHVQEEFRQRITGQDEAQRPHLPLERPITGWTIASKSGAVPQESSGAVACGPRNGTRERQYFDQMRWMLFLYHARRCSAPEGKCQEANCIKVQELWMHMERCSGHCVYPRCRSSKRLIDHNRNCQLSDCPVCVPFHHYIAAQRKAQIRPVTDTGSENSLNGSWKIVGVSDAARMTLKDGLPITEILDDLQSSAKRIKMEHTSPSLMPKSESSPVSVPSFNRSHSLLESQPQVCQQIEVPPISAKSEVIEAKIEPTLSSGLGGSSNFCDIKMDNLEDVRAMHLDVEPSTPNEPSVSAKIENIQVVVTDEANLEIKQETIAPPTDNVAGTKSGKPKIKGVSLTELFTPEQIKEHITGLRKWVGQSKAKAERNQAMEHSMSENSCQLCAVEKLTFEPPPIYCTTCGARIKRNAMYYTMGTGDTRNYFCNPCYQDVKSDTIEVDGATISKARLEKKRNDEETEEWWVQCDKCEAWQHQICALFNGRRNDGGQAEYTCPNCYVVEVERGERKPLPQSAVLGAKDLPRTILSDHIEQRLSKRLRQEKQERARVLGKHVDEIPGAEALVVRVVSSVDKTLEVKQRFLEIFQEENYPIEFPYKSKVVLLFQKIEGVEVCLFGMYVQEFGSECQFPNQRRVYLSYLDSVKYFRPEIKTVAGEALRTFVYHEILIGYLEYCKKRGFTSCYIWACPPLKGEDYILYCHPEIQKTPKSDKLREWYLAMLRKAARENIVVSLTNLYDHFFVSTGECKAKVTAARLPYFDGDYWPGTAEDMINQLRQEEDGRKQQKKGKTKKTITKRALKAAGQSDLFGNASKDALLMQKLGETICPMKEDFIMVHLQHACNHCCILMVSGKRWVCSQCKNFQLCEKCYDAEQHLEERDRHPINSREKHALSPFEVNDVPVDTKDKDEILESEFFDTRQAFLSLCQGNHYQYDTLRRAKHSSMMVLYHLHNPTAPAFVTTCNVCHHDVEAGQGWRCETCSDFDVCNACYQKEGGVDHPHRLTNHPSMADRDAQNKEARQNRVLQLRKMLDLLVHASQCRVPNCPYPNCRKVKGLFRHGIQCKKRASGGCVLCKKMWYLLQLHARACKESECHVPRCRDLKEHLRRLQQQSDSRRRAAVMEMMRQRAAEVAGNSG